MNSDFLVRLYIACSMDGFIAGANDDLSFLTSVQKEGEDYGYSEFLKSIDTVMLGRKTYEKVLSFDVPYPHSDRKTFVIGKGVSIPDESIVFFSGNLKNLISEIKDSGSKGIFVDGGAQLVQSMLNLELIDEITISTVPVMLGEGVRLFDNVKQQSKWETKSTKMFETGLVQTVWKKL